MKRFLSLLMALTLVSFSVPCRAALNQEVIEAIGSSIEVNEDSSVTVTEEYDFVALGMQISRGLNLGVPVAYRTPDGSLRHARFELISATLDGKSTSVKQDTTATRIMLRVGNPNELLSRGSHSIVIKYRLYKMVGFFEKHDELYWNAVSTSVSFPVLSAGIRVKLPRHEWGEGFKSVEWYVGQQGSKDQGHRAQLAAGNSVITTGTLAPGEGLTVVYTWDKGIIIPPPPGFFDKFGGLQYFAVAILLGLYYLFAWMKVGRDMPLGTVIPLFYPPAGVDPGTARYVVQQSHDGECFSANLIDLAVRGYVKIDGKKSVTRTDKKIDDSLPDAEQRLLEHIEGTIPLGSYSAILEGARTAAELSIRGMGDSLFTRNTGYWGVGILLLLLFPLLDLLAGYEVEFPELFALPVGIVISAVLAVVIIDKKRGAFMRVVMFAAAAAVVLFINLGAALIGYADIGNDIFIYAFLSATVCSFLVGLFLELMPNYNKKGNKLLAEAAGLKIYMNTAEKGRLEAFNPPDETPEVFERLLPWAFALGVAKTWADKFSKILERANYQPTWYAGDSFYLFYGGGINNFAASASMASQTPSASLGSTSSSGGGGGGFSGGGGGGTSVSGW